MESGSFGESDSCCLWLNNMDLFHNVVRHIERQLQAQQPSMLTMPQTCYREKEKKLHAVTQAGEREQAFL